MHIAWVSHYRVLSLSDGVWGSTVYTRREGLTCIAIGVVGHGSISIRLAFLEVSVVEFDDVWDREKSI